MRPGAGGAADGKCWAVIGVLSQLGAVGESYREAIRGSYLRDGDDDICIRFVLGAPRPPSNASGTSGSASTGAAARAQRQHAAAAAREATSRGDIVVLPGVPDSNCASKAFAWLAHAATAYPGAAWVGKADQDTYIRLPALAQDLRHLSALGRGALGRGAPGRGAPAVAHRPPGTGGRAGQPRAAAAATALITGEVPRSAHARDAPQPQPPAAAVVVGQFAWAPSWAPARARPAGSDAGAPCGRIMQLHDWVPRAMGGAPRALGRRPHGAQCNVSGGGSGAGRAAASIAEAESNTASISNCSPG